MTLSARVRMSVEGATDSQTVISKPNQYELAIHNKKLRVRFKTVLGDYDWQGDGKVDTGWHNIQATFDGSAVRTFVDGIQTYYARSVTGPLAADTSALYIGAQKPSVYGFWGTLDSVRVLSYAVNAQDLIVADSIAGFDTKVNANVDAKLATKANLSGASFDGMVRVGASGSPIAELEVVDSPNDSDSRANLYLRGQSGSGGVIRFYDNTIERATVRGDATPGDLSFQTGGTTMAGPGEKMRITSTGNVGIGTVTPGATLDVVGNIRTSATLIAGRWTNNNSYATAVGTIEATGTRYLELREGNNVKTFIDPTNKTNVAYFSQRFGIGDSTPPGNFVVRGGVAETGSGLPIILSAQQGAAGQTGGNIILSSGQNGTGGSNGAILFGTGGLVDANGQL
ncbi:MAG: LamG domain-containing protein, partial [Fibrobacterota bacterium]|nr:LamG domain-containing protein [Fibrobacterota bacterium]